MKIIMVNICDDMDIDVRIPNNVLSMSFFCCKKYEGVYINGKKMQRINCG